MANEFIDNIVSQKAFDQVADMRKALADLTKQYADLIKVINTTTTSGGGGGNTQALTEEAKIQREILRTKERIIALDSVASSGNKLGQDLMEQRDALKEINKELKNTNVISDSLAGMRLELAKLTKQYEAMGKAARESTGGQKLLKDIQSQTTAVTQLEQQMGNYKRNVGNYSNATFQLSQSLRELPAFAFSAQTGILALSNNLPMLIDAFNEVKKSTGSAGSALAVFARSIFTFTNLFTIAVGLFTVFYKEIMDFVSGGKQAIETTEEFKKAVSDASGEMLLLNTRLDEAKKGIISKEQFLETYNTTLGKVKGTTKDFNEAEQNTIDYAEDYIEYTRLKAKAVDALKDAIDAKNKAEANQDDTFMNVLKAQFQMMANGDVLTGLLQPQIAFSMANKKLLQEQESYKQKFISIQAELDAYRKKRGFDEPDPTNLGSTKPKKGTMDKEVNRIEEIKRLYELEKNLLETKFNDGLISEKQYYMDSMALADRYRKEREGLSKKEYETEVDFNKLLSKDKLTAREANLKSLLELEKEVVDMEDKAAQEAIKRATTMWEKRMALNRKYTQMQTDLVAAYIQAEDAYFDNIESERVQKLESLVETLGMVRMGLSELNNLSSQLSANDNADLDYRIEKQNELFELEESQIKQMGLSKEEEAKRLAKLEAQRGAQEKINAVERKKIQIEEARRNKAFAIMNILLSTAQSVISALAMTPPNVPLAIANGIVGGIQLATAMAVQIPQFAEGTDNAPEGYAIVGEKGTELVTEPDGKQWLTPAKDTLTYLKKGSKVTTNDELMEMVKNSAYVTLANMNKPITPDLYSKVLIEKFEENTNELRALKNIMKDKNMSTKIVGNFDHYMHVQKNIR